MKYYVGIDPGFAMVGGAVLRVDEDGARTIVKMDVLEARARKGYRKVDDNLRRLLLIFDWVNELIKGQPTTEVLAEAMSHVRSASVSTKIGMTWGALAAAAHINGVALRHVSPQTVRRHLVGIHGAPKEAVQIQIRDLFPDADSHLEHVARGKRDHAFDALAAAVTILDKDDLNA